MKASSRARLRSPSGSTTLASDNFDRADTWGTTNVIGTSSGGQTWTVVKGSFGIQSNQLRAKTISGVEAVATIDVGTSNCTVSMTNAGSSEQVWVVMRRVNTTDWLRVVLDTGNIYLQSRGTTLATIASTACSHVAGDVYKVILSGTSITVKVNNVTKITATSSTYQTGTGFGIGFDSTAATYLADDFLVTSP